MQFMINPDKLSRRVSELDSIEGELGNIASGLEDIISTNAIQMESYNQVRRALRNYRQNVHVISKNTSQMSIGLQNVLEEYKAHEQNIVENASHKGSWRPGGSGLIPGLSLPWSVLFPPGIWTLPSILPAIGEISSGIWKKLQDGIDVAFNSGKISQHVNVIGTDVGYDGEYHIGHLKTTGSTEASWDRDKGNVKAEANGKLSFSGIDGKISGNIGIVKGTLEASAVNASVQGAVGMSLFSDNKFTPAIYGEVKGKASVAEGAAAGQIGTDNYNVHAKAKGTWLGAEAEAKFSAGKIIEEKEGVKYVKYGVSGKVGAEAYAARGSVSGGFTLFGIKFDASIEGKAGGGGAKVGGEATSGAVEGELGLGLGVGLGLKFKVDWTGFKWPW